MNSHFLCNKSELKNIQTRGFSINTGDGTLELFLVKYDNDIKAYLNHCPHLGIPLNWQPDSFLSLEGTHIQCSTHGALFTFSQGDCIAGPCAGKTLTPINIKYSDDGGIWVAANPYTHALGSD